MLWGTSYLLFFLNLCYICSNFELKKGIFCILIELLFLLILFDVWKSGFVSLGPKLGATESGVVANSHYCALFRPFPFRVTSHDGRLLLILIVVKRTVESNGWRNRGRSFHVFDVGRNKLTRGQTNFTINISYSHKYRINSLLSYHTVSTGFQRPPRIWDDTVPTSSIYPISVWFFISLE